VIAERNYLRGFSSSFLGGGGRKKKGGKKKREGSGKTAFREKGGERKEGKGMG